MKDYVILTDSCCDLSAEMAEELELRVLPLSFVMEGKEYFNHLDYRDISAKDFYSRVRGGALGTTSAINVAVFTEVMTELVSQGKDVLCIAFSSGLSTTYQSAAIAAGEVMNAHPGSKVLVCDSRAASLGQGMLVYQAAKMRQQGKSMDEVRDWAEQNKLRQCHWFTVNDLFFLKKGGRVSAATAVVGTMLQIKPVLHVDDEGHLINVAKARGRKASLTALVDKVGELADDPASQTMFISNSDCAQDAQFVADEIKKRYGTREIILNSIGPVIGAHTGPGCVALFFMGKHR